MRSFFLLLFALPILSTCALGQLVDGGFTESTGPGDVDLVVVRERSYGAAGIDLSLVDSNLGVTPFVQSIYVRARHGSGLTQHRAIRGRLIFPSELSIITVVSGALDLGGAADDGVLSGTDAMFGLLGANPDDYSAPQRGLEGQADSEYVSVRSNNTIDFHLHTNFDDVDDFRVLVGYPGAFQAGISFEVELYYDEGTAHFDHFHEGIQIGDPAGGVLGNGDYGEVRGLSGIPLTSAVAPVATQGRPVRLWAQNQILVARVGGLFGGNHIEGYDAAEQITYTHARRGEHGRICRGPSGYVYCAELNLPGYAISDLVAGGVGSVHVANMMSPLSHLCGRESGHELVMAGNVSGANSDVRVVAIDTTTALVTERHIVANADIGGIAGVAQAGNEIHVVGTTGKHVVIDRATGGYTSTALSIGNSVCVDLEVDAAETELYLLRREGLSRYPHIDTIDVASGALQSDRAIATDMKFPIGITRDENGLVWINSTGAVDVDLLSDIAAYDPSGWTRVHFTERGGNPNPADILADVHPNSLGARYCSPAVESFLDQPGWIAAHGSDVAADNWFFLAAYNLPSLQFGLFLNANAAGFTPNPGGSDGNLCLGGSIGRHNAQIFSSASFGAGRIQVDLGSLPRNNGPVAVVAGDRYFFQCWFRQPNGTSNLTDAIEVVFQ